MKQTLHILLKSDSWCVLHHLMVLTLQTRSIQKHALQEEKIIARNCSSLSSRITNVVLTHLGYHSLDTESYYLLQFYHATSYIKWNMSAKRKKDNLGIGCYSRISRVLGELQKNIQLCSSELQCSIRIHLSKL